MSVIVLAQTKLALGLAVASVRTSALALPRNALRRFAFVDYRTLGLVRACPWSPKLCTPVA